MAADPVSTIAKALGEVAGAIKMYLVKRREINTDKALNIAEEIFVVMDDYIKYVDLNLPHTDEDDDKVTKFQKKIKRLKKKFNKKD